VLADPGNGKVSAMSRWLAQSLLVAALVVVLSPPAAAQDRGAVEAGIFGRGTLFDPSLEVKTGVGVGIRAAVFLAPQWLVEADLSISGVDGLAAIPETSYRPLHFRVSYVRPSSERARMVVGLGLVATRFGGDFGESDTGVGGLFGFRVELPRSLIARVDGTLDYVPAPANGAGDNWNAGLQIGVGYRLR